ncbi:hypothetical protein [Mangrovibacter yixingensis]|uniref:hypothetical protein n=1 Tax=Mangrovibacter yixingensis TaxID=1529639 RepID=UPI001CFAD1B2|nr:hypothetical protein [Mangrovibacter yixingensis]
MTWNDIVITNSIWPPVIYYIVSIIVGLLLFVGKYYVHRRANFTVFMLYGLVVIFCGGCQLALFRFGGGFPRDILRVNLDVYSYDSIFYGSYLFALVYALATPIRFK